MKISHHPASIETDITVHLWGNGAYPLDGSQHACRAGVCQLPSVFYRPAQDGRHCGTGRGVPEIQHAARLRPGERGMLHDVTTVRTCQYHHAHRPLGARGRPSVTGRLETERTTDTASDSDGVASFERVML